MIMSRRFIALCFVMMILVFASLPVFAQDEIPVDDLVVVNTTEIDLVAGPMNTAAILAPDGSQFAYFNQELCFYALPEVEETGCVTFPEESRPELDSVTWSPDSRYLVMMDNDLLRFFNDTDILLVDSAEGTVVNMTQDDYDEGLFDIEETITVDIAPQWRDETTFMFIRYELDEDGSGPAFLYTMAVDDDEPALMLQAPLSQGKIDVYMLATQPKTNQYAYNLNQRDTDLYGVLLSNDEDFPVNIMAAVDRDSRAGNIFMMSISADGEYVMSHDGRALAQLRFSDPEQSVAKITNTDTFVTSVIDEEHFITDAGWSPTGHDLAYIVRDLETPENEGLYIRSIDGEARQILTVEGPLWVSTPRRAQGIIWASNNTILLTQASTNGLILIELGTE